MNNQNQIKIALINEKHIINKHRNVLEIPRIFLLTSSSDQIDSSRKFRKQFMKLFHFNLELIGEFLIKI